MRCSQFAITALLQKHSFFNQILIDKVHQWTVLVGERFPRLRLSMHFGQRSVIHYPKAYESHSSLVITPQHSRTFWPFPLAAHQALLLAGALCIPCCSYCCILLLFLGCFWWQFPDFQSQFLNYSAILPQLPCIVPIRVSALASTELLTHYTLNLAHSAISTLLALLVLYRDYKIHLLANITLEINEADSLLGSLLDMQSKWLETS